jgi:hypothetical protein
MKRVVLFGSSDAGPFKGTVATVAQLLKTTKPKALRRSLILMNVINTMSGQTKTFAPV